MRETLVSPLHSTLHINSFLDFETEFATFSTFSQDCLKCGPRIWGFRTENRRRNNRPKSLLRSPVVGDFYGTGVEIWAGFGPIGSTVLLHYRTLTAGLLYKDFATEQCPTLG